MIKRHDMQPHMLIFGERGSDKTALVKKEIATIAKEHPGDRIFLLTSYSDYACLEDEVGSDNYHEEMVGKSKKDSCYWPLNPLDFRIEDLGEGVNLSIYHKTEYMFSFMECILNTPLTPLQMKIIDKTLTRLYALNGCNQWQKQNDIDPKSIPTLSDFWEELKKTNTQYKEDACLTKEEEESANLMADALEVYAIGALNLFAHKTNPEFDNAQDSLVVYNFGSMRNDLVPWAMLTVFETIWWHSVDQNTRTWIYVDDIDFITKSEALTRMLSKAWKRSRILNIVLTGITQSAEDICKENLLHIENNSGIVWSHNASI